MAAKTDLKRIRKQASIMFWSLKGTTIKEPGRKTILENGLRIINEELAKGIGAFDTTPTQNQ